MTTAVLDWLNRKGKSAGVRLTQLTGKSPDRIHPKHLIDFPGQHWYLDRLRPEDLVLDLGCGHGAHLARTSAVCREIIGVDRDVAALRIARRRPGITRHSVVAWDLRNPLPWRTARFTAILCLDLLEHIDDRQALLRECHRVLIPGGRLFLSVPNRTTRWRDRLRRAGRFSFADPDHRVEYTREELLAEIDHAGFTTITPLDPVVYDTPWAGLIDTLGGLSLTLYRILSRWKRNRALREPDESTGFRVVCRT